jgi:hypothetical protein
LREVKLAGLSRTISAQADGGVSVVTDVESVRSSIQDQFHVPSIKLEAEISTDETTLVDVSFTEMVAVAQKPVPLSYLIDVASRLMTSNYPPPPSDVAKLIS